MAYIAKPADGLHFSTPKFPNCVVAAFDTGGVGQVVFTGTAPVGSIEYDALALLYGPNDMSGDLGPFLTALVPIFNSTLLLPDGALAQSVPTWIHDTALSGNTGTNVQTVNIGLRQYFQIINGQMSFKPYP